MNWKLAAKTAGAELKAFNTPQEFATTAETFPRDIPIYIDYELGSDITGEDIARDLRGKGFTDLPLATCHAPDKFKHLPWLKVAGKEPPPGLHNPARISSENIRPLSPRQISI